MSRGLNVFVNIGAKVGSSVNSAARATERRFQQMGRSARLAAAEAKAAWRGMERNFSTFATNVSMPAAILTGMGARAALEWSKVGNELQAVSQMSDGAREKIEAVARSMPGNPAENLKAALDLARTGFDAQQIAGSLGVTVKLGMSDSSVDTAEAADIMTNVMKGMNMPDATFAEVTASAERTANNIAFAAAKSSTDVRLMGESFKYAAPIASRLGIEMEDLSGYFMTMADAGIKGSEAGVSFRSGLVRLLKPTKGSAAVLARYNMELADYVKTSKKATAADVVNTLNAQGIDASGASGAIAALMNSPNLSGAPLIQKISEAVADGMGQGADAADLDKISDGVMMAMTAGVSKVDFQKFIQDGVTKGWTASDFAHFFDVRQGTRLMTLWGKDAIRNIDAVKGAMERLARGEATFLDKMYLTQMKGAVGPWEKMKQGMGNLVISMAESGAMDAFANGMNKVAGALMSLSKVSPGTLKWLTYGLVGIAALAPLGFALMGVGAGLKLVFGGLRLATMVLAPLVSLGPMLLNGLATLAPFVVKGLVMAFALLSNPIGWAIILAGVAAALIYYFRDDLAKAWPKVVTFFKNAWQGIKNYALSINWSGIGMRIADALTFGLASKIKPSTWGGILRGAASGFGSGGITGAVAGGIAGARAKGGPVRRGGMYLVGEQGPELWRAPGNGRVINASRTAALLGVAGAAMTPMAAAASPASPAALSATAPMQVTVNINGAQDPRAIAVEVRRELARLANGQRGLLSD